MIYSMTGYGKALLQLPTKNITVELKSLNSKTLDLNIRMPPVYREKELSLRKTLARALDRGKVDCSIFIEATAEVSTATINIPVIRNYMSQLQAIAGSSEIELLKMAVRLPEALSTPRKNIDDTEWQAVEEAVYNAITNMTTYRKDEGLVLENDFRKRIDTLDVLLTQVTALDPERIKTVRKRLLASIEALKTSYSEDRFEQELIYYIEKLDITEEKVRLKNHLDYFVDTLESEKSNGKKLGFISQEIGREINTIGSKSNYAPMQLLVVRMKDELEKVKEQLLNVL